MRRRYALPALLMLALSCAACSTEAAQVHPSPTVVPPSQAATPASTVSAPTGTPRPDSQPTLPPVPRYFTEAFDAKPPRWVFLQVDNGQPFSGATVRDGFLVFD